MLRRNGGGKRNKKVGRVERNTIKFRMNTELQRAHDRLKQVVREMTLECSISLNDWGTNEKE